MKFYHKLVFIFLLSFLFSSQANSDFNEDEVECLSYALYFEARGEGYKGIRAVGHAILNRANNRGLTICQTVTEPSKSSNYKACAFSFYCDGKPEVITDIKAWNLSKTIAFRLLDNQYPFSSVGNADHYLRCDIKDKIWWTKRLRFVTRVKNHCFYSSKEK